MFEDYGFTSEAYNTYGGYEITSRGGYQYDVYDPATDEHHNLVAWREHEFSGGWGVASDYERDVYPGTVEEALASFTDEHYQH